ncbi:hypothetical protein Q5P01_025039 [Channa striata]|uniref:Lysozyme g n=1 Tax=Channa striata TaxID=64152 RepID=A0AA88IQ74_CHASR|nr:hypothetical protein Q5P01_025039 [Channa striata]
MKIETSGASAKTAQQDRLECKGVEASHIMAKTDAERMEEYREKIKKVGDKYYIDPALIAGIISRESRARKTGLMKVDVNPNRDNNTPRGEWDCEEHLCQATKILVDFIDPIREKFPKWSAEQQLKGAIAAYNVGVQSVCSYSNVDEYTTGGDYSNDVVARAQWYKKYGGF